MVVNYDGDKGGCNIRDAKLCVTGRVGLVGDAKLCVIDRVAVEVYFVLGVKSAKKNAEEGNGSLCGRTNIGVRPLANGIGSLPYDATMTLNNLSPMLWTKDLNSSVQFYTETLGFTCDSKAGGWASVKRDGIRIMLSLPNDHEPFQKSMFTGSFYFDCDGVDTLWASLKDKTKVCYAIEDFEYGRREFAIYDNNGYILQFGQPI
jgi:uncharacterized glyoxalase superfamily protein PhnB